MLRRLDDQTSVSGQVRPEEVAELAAQGITMIINNRPDGEEADQPMAAEIDAAARAVGIAYHHIPIIRGIGPADAEEMHEALTAAGDGQVLAFCRSGNRSALIWAVAAHEAGRAREDVEAAVEGAGFNVAPIAHLL